MSKKSYWRVLSQDVLSNRFFFFGVIFVTVLCFGFTITNFSIGVDDPSRSYYLYTDNSGSMIQQGRLMHVVVNLLTRSIQFIPFFTDFTGASLYALSALLFCALFLYITDGKLSRTALFIFAGTYISSSIITEKFIYHLDVIVTMLSYCLGALSLLYAFRFVKEKKPALFVTACLYLMGSLGSYESFLFLYFCGVFGIFILQIVINEEPKSFSQLLREGLQYAAILIAATVFYYFLVYIVQILTNQHGFFVRYSAWRYSDSGFLSTFLQITKSLKDYIIHFVNNRYLPILVFCFFSLVGFALFVYLSVRRKHFWLFLCYCALWFGNFLIHYASGDLLLRTAQTFCYFVGFVCMILLEQCSFRFLKRIVLFAAALLIFVQSADMNRWFYNDYIRYQKEAFMIHSIASKLAAEHDLSKGVVVVNTSGLNYLQTDQYSGRQVNGNSVLYWATVAFNDPTQPFIGELFRMHGYHFIQSPTPEQYQAAQEIAWTLPPWPSEGSIQEFDTFIVVNLA